MEAHDGFQPATSSCVHHAARRHGGNVLADKLGATVTPETYFVDAKNVLLYHGAIDNDKSGKAITEKYLRTAFDETLSGKKVANTRKLAFGCSIKKVAAQ